MSKSPLPHLDKPDEETIDKMKSSDYSKNQKVQDEILKLIAITITAIITVISCMKKRVLKNIKSLFFCFLVLP